MMDGVETYEISMELRALSFNQDMQWMAINYAAAQFKEKNNLSAFLAAENANWNRMHNEPWYLLDVHMQMRTVCPDWPLVSYSINDLRHD